MLLEKNEFGFKLSSSGSVMMQHNNFNHVAKQVLKKIGINLGYTKQSFFSMCNKLKLELHLQGILGSRSFNTSQDILQKLENLQWMHD